MTYLCGFWREEFERKGWFSLFPRQGELFGDVHGGAVGIDEVLERKKSLTAEGSTSTTGFKNVYKLRPRVSLH